MYGPQYLINLIDKKGSEMTKVHRKMKDNDLHYIWFDFHGECKKMKWENLSKLVNSVDSKLKEWSHFMAEVKYGYDNRPQFNES